MAQHFSERLGRMGLKRSIRSPLSDGYHAEGVDRSQPFDDALEY
jgi:hypothetical protein